MPLTHIEFGAEAKSDVLNDNFEYLEQETLSIKNIANSSSFTKYDETKEYAKDEIITVIDTEGKIVAYISQSDKNKGNALTDETYWKKSELGGSANLPIGMIFAASASTTFVPENSLPCDGMEYSKDQFKALYNDWLVAKRLETCTYTEYQQEVTTNGACAKFGIDTANGKFKVPLIPDGYYIKKGQGTANKAGLPNITGTFGVTDDDTYNRVGETSGAFYNTGVVKGNTQAAPQLGNNLGQIVGFDSSRSNLIYGKSDTVETNAVGYRYFVVVATGSIKQSEMDWSQWASSLEGKMNKDHSNDTKPYLKTAYVNGASGYNIYSNGYCEQWGISESVNSSSIANITFLKKYINIPVITFVSEGETGTSAELNLVINSKTVSGFTSYNGCIKTMKYNWVARGYLSEGEY